MRADVTACICCDICSHIDNNNMCKCKSCPNCSKSNPCKPTKLRNSFTYDRYFTDVFIRKKAINCEAVDKDVPLQSIHLATTLEGILRQCVKYISICKGNL